MQFVKNLAVALTCCGALMPQFGMAAGPRVATATAPAAKPMVMDVALSNGGTFKGQIVDAQGRGVDGASVSILQNGREVAKTVANREGYFSVTNLRGGVHQVVGGQGQQVYRFWTEKTAPPSAKSHGLIVSDKKVVRGQFVGMDGFTLGILGAAVTGAVISGVNLGKINDLEDDNSDLKKQFGDLSDKIDDLSDQVDELDDKVDELLNSAN